MKSKEWLEMSDSKNVPLIHTPHTIAEALGHLQSYPKANILAGCTQSLPEGMVVISLHRIEELKKVHLSEKYLDIGSGVTLEQALSLKNPRFTPIFDPALKEMGPLGLRNQATLGGNICRVAELGDLFPLLLATGSTLEFRTQRGSHWYPASALMDRDGPRGSLELLTRIRIPMVDWSASVYEKVGKHTIPFDERLSLTALMQFQGNGLSLIRVLFYLPPWGLLRTKTMETFLVGQELPLGEKEREKALQYLEYDVKESSLDISSYRRSRIRELVKGLLWQLNP